MYGKILLSRSTHNICPPYTHHEYHAHKESVWESLEKHIQRTRTYQKQVHVNKLTEQFQCLFLSTMYTMKKKKVVVSIFTAVESTIERGTEKRKKLQLLAEDQA